MKYVYGVIPQHSLLCLIIIGAGLLGPATPVQAQEYVSEEIATMVAPPGVPAPITRKHPAKVVVHLETNERKLRLADGVEYTFWTFGGSVPGPMIRVREGDYVEFHLSNHPTSQNPHNIDHHAATGPGGGAHSSLIAPGHSATFGYKALNPGLYVYHCATAPVGMHVANGMYGMILVEPKEGLPPVDREYYVMQGEFYTRDDYGVPGHQPFDMRKALDENPPYVVFNGAVGALTDDRALVANVDETVRLFVGNGGPNLISSFHVIGEIFDRVWIEGGDAINRNIQTTMIPAGGSTVVEFKVDVPGTLIMVDHSIFRAFNKGALGMINVSGEDRPEIYTGRIAEGIYLPEGGAIQSIAPPPIETRSAQSIAERIELGRQVYAHNCTACHQAEGGGIAGVFPPVAGSDYLNADPERAIAIILKGLSGEIVVNGVTYNSAMPAVALSDEDVSNVLTYIYSQWGNSGTVITPEQVSRVRNAL